MSTACTIQAHIFFYKTYKGVDKEIRQTSKVGMLFWFRFLFLAELLYLVTLVDTITSTDCVMKKVVYLLIWTRWMLGVQILNPDFQWTYFTNILFWLLETLLPSIIYFNNLWLRSLFFAAIFISYLLTSNESVESLDKGGIFLLLMSIFLVLVTFISIIFTSFINYRMYESLSSTGKGGALCFNPFLQGKCVGLIPLLHALFWAIWGLLLITIRIHVGFLFRFACTCSLFSKLIYSI